MRLAYGAAARGLKLAAAVAVLASPAAAETVIAALGDSLVAGYGLPPEEGFVPTLEGWLEAQGADVRVINAGVSGDTTAGGLARADWTLTDEVDALILALGANDMLRGLDPGQATANLAAILDKAAARDLPVLLVGMSAPANYGPDYKREFEAIYPDLAERENVALYPRFFDALTDGEESLAAVRRYMQPDGIHPNAEGVERIVDDIGPAVLALVD